MRIATIFSFIFLICLLLLFVFKNSFISLVNKNNNIQKESTEITSRPEVVKEVVEKVMVKGDIWDSVQPKFKDTVVQVFAQIAEFNWLEPYKSPNQAQGYGSGFFINDKGHIITNAHVVNQAVALSIQIPSLGKEQIDVEIIGVSFDRDMALLKIKDSELEFVRSKLGQIPYVTLGDSDKVKRTNEVMALGYPLGMMSLKSTIGVVSGRESVMGRQLIQIDAAINPGNSGGPVSNVDGKIIGIATAGVPSAQNVGYIIPINELKLILNDLYNVKENKILRKPFLGVFYNPSNRALTQYLGNPEPGGCYVTNVYNGSILHQAGVEAGDMLYEIDKHAVDMYGDICANWCEDKISLVDYVSFIPLGQEVSLIVYRKGVRKEFKFKFQQSKLPVIRIMYPEHEKIDYEILGGMVIMQLTRNHIPYLIQIAPELIKYEESKNQVSPVLIISHILPDSQTQRSHVFAPGTRIKEVNNIEVNTLDDFRNAVKKSLSTGFLSIKSFNDIFTVFYLNKIIQDELRLPQIYRYPVSALVENLIKAYMEKNENKPENKSNQSSSESIGNVTPVAVT